MNPLLSVLVLTLSAQATAARVAWSPTLVAARARADVFASFPRDLALWRGHTRALTVAPTGADGPPSPLSFDPTTAGAQRDRLKSDRVADLHAVGGGVVLTLTSF